MSEFVQHRSGPNPVPGRYVTVQFRGGGTNHGWSTEFLNWHHEACGRAGLIAEDIVGYRVEAGPIPRPRPASGKRPYTRSARWFAARPWLAAQPADKQVGTERSGVNQKPQPIQEGVKP